MKRNILLTFVFCFIFYTSPVSSQIPQYTLEAKNFDLRNDTTLTFDLVFTHTDTTVMQLAGWQFFFKVPQTIGTLSSGTGPSSSFIYDSTGGDAVSDLPAAFRPKNPNAVPSLNAPGFYELRMAANSLPGCGGGLLIPQNVPTLIGRFKIKSSSTINVSAIGNFSVRDSCESPLSVTRTKINWYDYITCLNSEMTRCANHSIDYSSIIFNPTIILKIVPEGLYNLATDKLFRKENATMYLRNINSPYQILDSSVAEIDSVNLTAAFNFEFVQLGNYYFSVMTRNTIETWCKEGGILVSNSGNEYDMTSSSSQAYGGNMVQRGNRFCIYSGNVNNDQIIDSDDLGMIDNDVFNYVLGNGATNLNGDNIVDIDDMAIVDKNVELLITSQFPGKPVYNRSVMFSKN